MLHLKSIKHQAGQLASPRLIIISITIAFLATRFGYAGVNLYKLNAVGKPSPTSHVSGFEEKST